MYHPSQNLLLQGWVHAKIYDVHPFLPPNIIYSCSKYSNKINEIVPSLYWNALLCQVCFLCDTLR